MRVESGVRVGVATALRACLLAAVPAGALALTAGLAAAETLRDALVSAYHANPRLDAERSRLRATDEEVPRAKAGFRPQVSGSADTGRQKSDSSPKSAGAGDASPWGYSINVSQSIFQGFRTVHAVNEAEATVRAGREALRSIEQQVLLDVVTAYCDVVRDSQVVRLREHHVKVLSQEFTAIEARRIAREVTKTDVAQAKARRAKSLSQLDQAKASLKASRANFEKVVGRAPSHLVPPAPPSEALPRSLEEALTIAERESPVVNTAVYREQAARFSVSKIRGELLPEIKLEASYQQRYNPSPQFQEQDASSVSGRLTIPLYEGGETYARVRQAKHTQVSRLQDIEQARAETQAAVTQAWSRYGSTRSQVKSDQVQVEAGRTALEGVREEEKVNQRTVLDVLNAEQELLDAEIELANTRREVVVAAYAVLAQTGRLNGEELVLADKTYDPTAHYEEVRNKWFGLSITRPNGRKQRIEVPIDRDPEWILEE